MNFNDVISARRAVRSFTPKKVDDPTIRALLRAAVQAPSAMNAQPWHFAIVQDTSKLKRYSDRAKALLLDAPPDAKSTHYEQMLRDAHFNVFYDATTLIVICGKDRSPYIEADCWLAAQNLMLAACDMGLGTCPIGFAIRALNNRDIKEELQIPLPGVAVAPIIVGYPSAPVAPVARAEPHVLSWAR
ncbi:MAG TPA: nitroreductase family protein [Polyangiaceae bacterium]|nr:nitroreductase family protein [Polyangiaceae bacterium]